MAGTLGPSVKPKDEKADAFEELGAMADSVLRAHQKWLLPRHQLNLLVRFIIPIPRIVCTISFHYSCPWISSMSCAVLLLWIVYVFVLSCVCYVFVRVCLYVLCGHLLGKG